MLLSDISLSPQVFDGKSYGVPHIGSENLRFIKEQLRDYSIVRDLRDGDWSKAVLDIDSDLSQKTKELMKNLRIHKRLVKFPAELDDVPVSEFDWCKEALASHNSSSLDGIIVTKNEFPRLKDCPKVARIDRVEQKDWWNKPSVQFQKSIDNYQEKLKNLFRYSNSLMFIDPYLNPSRFQYKDFFHLLLEQITSRNLQPRIELHRKCVDSENPSSKASHWEAVFRNALVEKCHKAGVKLYVYIWDDFHDRFIISDLLGILMGSGFDTNSNPASTVMLSRLSREVRDKVQKEFDKACAKHNLLLEFEI